MIYENIRKLCSEAHVSISRLERETGLGNGTIFRWKTGDPTVSKLKLVADYFGVSVDSLLRVLQHEGNTNSVQ